MSAHGLLRLGLEVDGLEILRHVCYWVVMICRIESVCLG